MSFLRITLSALFGLMTQQGYAAEPVPSPWSAVCRQLKSFHDGDTLTCIDASPEAKSLIVRFAGIDAPETGQAYWRASRNKLRELAVPGTVASCYKVDRFGRQVCRLSSPSGEDLADGMLASGLAWHAVSFADEQTSDERARYARLERDARIQKFGLWAEPEPMQPWKCRQLRRRHQKCR